MSNKRECDDCPGPGSCAFSPKHLAPLMITSIENDKLKPAEAGKKLKEYCARELTYSFLKRVVNYTKALAGIESSKGDDIDSVAMLPCYVAAFNSVGWRASFDTCTAKEMKNQIVEMAKSAHDRDEKQKKNECQRNKETFVASRFDPSGIPDLDKNRKYVNSYTLSPLATAPHLWGGVPDVLVSADFAHCSYKGEPTGTLGCTVGHDLNGHLIELGECLSFELS